MGCVFISSSEWNEEIPTSPSLYYQNHIQTYAGFAFLFYCFSLCYFYYRKVVQRQHRDTTEWRLGIKTYACFLDTRWDVCDHPLWWERMLPNAPKERGSPALRLVARRPSSAGLISEDQSDLRLPSATRQKLWSWQSPKSSGEHKNGRFTASKGVKNPNQGEPLILCQPNPECCRRHPEHRGGGWGAETSLTRGFSN